MKSAPRLTLAFALVVALVALAACAPSATQPPNATAPGTTTSPGSETPTSPAATPKSTEPSPVAQPASSLPTTPLADVDGKIGDTVNAGEWKIDVRSVGLTNTIGGTQMKAGGIMQLQVGISNGSSATAVLTPANFKLEGAGSQIKPAPGPGIKKKVAAGKSVTSSAFFLVPNLTSDYVLVFTPTGSKTPVRIDVRTR